MMAIDSDRATSLVLYVLGQMQNHEQAGRVQSNLGLNDEGMKEFRTLVASSFKPTQSELRWAILAIQHDLGGWWVKPKEPRR